MHSNKRERKCEGGESFTRTSYTLTGENYHALQDVYLVLTEGNIADALVHAL